MRLDVSTYQPQLSVLTRFVEGQIDGPTLEAALATEEMKSLLGAFEEARYPALTNHYRRLFNKQDRTTLGGLVNAEGIIEDFLRKADVTFHPANRFGNAYSLILKSMPKYLDPPMDFLEARVLPNDSSLSASQKQKHVKERLKELFTYADKPPKWVQSPDWPIRNGNPLFFVGQLPVDAPHYFHDSGVAYLFFDSQNGTFETVAQFY